MCQCVSVGVSVCQGVSVSMYMAATCVWWRATMVRGCFARSGTSFMLVRMLVVQFNVSPHFAARNGIRAQQTEITPRRRENYSTDSPMISNVKTKGVNITK